MNFSSTSAVILIFLSAALLLQWTDASVLINEIAPSATDGDWIELFNSGNSSVDLSGYRISDTDDVELTDKSFVLPANTQLAAGAFLVLRFLAADTAPPLPALSTTLFRLSSEGETLTLATANGQLVDRVTFGNDVDNIVDGSIGRKMDGGDVWCVFALASQGTANSAATPGDVVGVRDPDWHQDSHSKKKNLPLYDDVFDTTSLQKVVLEFESEQWQICWDSMVALAGPFGTGRMGGGGMTRPNNTMMMQPNNTMTMMMMGGNGGASDILGGEATYVQVTVRYRGRVWRRVGFRWKGNSSLQASWSGGFYKLPFRLDFDKFEDDFPAIKNQRFYGFGKMTFGSNFGDGSGMRELVMQTAYANMDVAAARGSLVQVFMDRGDGVQTKVGIYTMIEDPGDDNGLPRRLFNDDGNGNIYKPDGNGGRFTTPLQTSTIELKAGGAVDANFTDVLAVAAAAHASTRRTAAAEWRANFERVFDVDDFVRWAIVTRAYGSWDQYGQFLPHNYYLYCNLTATPCTWVAWDGNFVLGSSIGGGGGGGNMPANMSNMGMGMSSGNFSLPGGTRPMRGNMTFPGGNMSFPMGGGGGGGGGGMSGGALNLADTAEGSWPLLAFVRDDPVYFAIYREAARRLLTSSNSLIGNLTMLDEFIDHWDSIIGAELALETYPFSTLANGTANTYKADVDKLRSSVTMYRTLLVAFVGNDTGAVNATSTNDATVTPTGAGGSTVATSSANDMSMTATMLLATMLMVQIIFASCM